jgi:hypothetical protein
MGVQPGGSRLDVLASADSASREIHTAAELGFSARKVGKKDLVLGVVDRIPHREDPERLTAHRAHTEPLGDRPRHPVVAEPREALLERPRARPALPLGPWS